MTISNDYIAQTLHNDRAEELRREAATARLARQATRRLRPRRASRDRNPSPPIPRQRSSSAPTAAKVA